MADITGITSGLGASATRADSSAAKLADGFDDFLTLLTTQLQHQDPTDPMDSNEFTNQLVQFSSVEQQIQTNQNLETLTSLTAVTSQNALANYLGKDALVPGNFGIHDGTSGVEWQYNTSSAAEKVTLEVYNSSDELVYTTTGVAVGGIHEFNWDGTNDAGETLPEGTYSLNVKAENEDGDALETGVAVRGRITAVTMNGIDATFEVGPLGVALEDIIQLSTP